MYRRVWHVTPCAYATACAALFRRKYLRWTRSNWTGCCWKTHDQTFEQQGKTVTVTLIQEGFVTPKRWPVNCRCCRKKIATGCVKFSVLMVNPGCRANVVPESTLSGPELALQQLGKTPLGRYLFTSSNLPVILLRLVAMPNCGASFPPSPERQTAAADGAFLPASPLY
jgi:chorismate--pyruvate lyase